MATVRHPKATFFVQQHLFAGLTSFAELERRIAALPDEQSRGAAFEVFAEAYLATQRIHQAREVWPGDTMPPSLQQRLRLPLKDMGVDGVFVTTSDETACYQVKFRTGRPSLTWSELSTFFGLADAGVQRLVLTNCDEIADTAAERPGAVFVRGSDLDQLTAEDFQAIEAWLVGSIAPKKKKTPLEHQNAALSDILNGLNRHPRVTALMACGSGKTLIALWTAERRNAKTVLVLLPSLALVRQTLHEWLRETSWPDVEYRCVCSDATVQPEEDALIVRPSEVDFLVTTQSGDIRRFLERQTNAVKLVFSTYHSAAVVAEAVVGLTPFDLGVFDEAHKTAGREGMKFGLALTDNNLPIARRLFLTATPRHYDIAPENKSGEDRTVFSMDVPEIYGPVVHRLPFSTAAKLGIITDYKVLISIVTSDMVTDELLRRGIVIVEGEEIKARQVANQIALKSAIDQHGVSRVFTFHSKVAAANSFTSAGPEGIATHLPGFHCAHINGAMSTAYRKRLMDEFANAPRAILSNARCLTEGVDVPAVDMVAFLSPRRSLVDIVQATGRAMRLSPGKKFGYVLVPLYVEKARGESITEAVKRSDFDEVWNVLRKLQEHDDLLAQIISEMRIQRGATGGYDDTRLRERLQFIGPAISLESLRESITAACLDAIGDGWFECYGQLLTYQKKHGKIDMPARWPENQKLATWVVTQRVLQRDGALEEEKIELLNRVGFKWSPHASTWRTYYLALLDYRNRFGDCFVPLNWKENKKLARWVSSQRVNYGRNKLSRERIAMLEKIGFEWTGGVATWEERFAELCAYKERFGDTLVPVKWKENPLLGGWVSAQRYKGNQGKLNKEYEIQLNSIGFEWKAPNALPPQKTLQDRIDALLAHKAEYGHLNVSRHNKKYAGLANWMTVQRRLLKIGTISAEDKKHLDEINFPWDSVPANTDKQWYEMFERFKIYKSANGASSVKIVDEETAKLNRWVLSQRRAKKNGWLSDERFHLLNGVGFIWQINKTKPAPKLPPEVHKPVARPWDEMFSELRDFFKLHGHCNVPADWQANPELARWVYHQREDKRQNRLIADQVRQMDGIGFAWSMSDSEWDVMFAKLVEHLRPMHNGKPRGRVMDAQLRRWIVTQRQFQKNGQLDATREQKLTSIGFEWQPYSKQWEQMFEMLRQFHTDHGHCRVPAKWSENLKLANWVAVQRARRTLGKVSAERIAALDALGFSWSGRESSGKAWEEMFAKLKEFQQKNGHADVPQKFATNRKLGWWVSTQRRDRKTGKLNSNQISQLDSIGFSWSPQSGGTTADDEGWKATLASLQSFKDEHGHCRVPAKWSENPKLANWVATQRRFKKTGELKAERVAALNEIGFEWITERRGTLPPLSQRGSLLTAGQVWEAMFVELEKYKQTNGNCLVPQSWKGNRRLADWVSDQRVANNKGKLDREKCRRLDELGFDWDPNNSHWEDCFRQLVEFKKEFGHTNVPQRSDKYEALGTWVRNQRAAKRYKRPIMAERAKRLDEIGFVWVLVEPMAWEKMFAALVEYKKVHNHCNVPQKAGEYKRLGKWVNTQRTRNFRGKLRADRKQLLDSIGFVWNLRPNLPTAV
jgi:superfamily II DNA or RNA helicase